MSLKLKRGHSRKKSVGQQALLIWVQKRVNNRYPRVDVKNFTSSWKDSLAMCALISNFEQELLDEKDREIHVKDLSIDSKEDVEANFELCFKVALELGVPRLLEPEDMTFGKAPDKLSTTLYVSEVRKRLDPHAEETSPRRSLRSPRMSRLVEKRKSEKSLIEDPSNGKPKVFGHKIRMDKVNEAKEKAEREEKEQEEKSLTARKRMVEKQASQALQLQMIEEAKAEMEAEKLKIQKKKIKRQSQVMKEKEKSQNHQLKQIEKEMKVIQKQKEKEERRRSHSELPNIASSSPRKTSSRPKSMIATGSPRKNISPRTPGRSPRARTISTPRSTGRGKRTSTSVDAVHARQTIPIMKTIAIQQKPEIAEIEEEEIAEPSEEISEEFNEELGKFKQIFPGVWSMVVIQDIIGFLNIDVPQRMFVIDCGEFLMAVNMINPSFVATLWEDVRAIEAKTGKSLEILYTNSDSNYQHIGSWLDQFENAKAYVPGERMAVLKEGIQLLNRERVFPLNRVGLAIPELMNTGLEIEMLKGTEAKGDVSLIMSDKCMGGESVLFVPKAELVIAGASLGVFLPETEGFLPNEGFLGRFLLGTATFKRMVTVTDHDLFQESTERIRKWNWKTYACIHQPIDTFGEEEKHGVREVFARCYKPKEWWEVWRVKYFN